MFVLGPKLSFTINRSFLSLLLFDPPAQPTGNVYTNKQNRDEAWAQVLACNGLWSLIFSTHFGTVFVQPTGVLQAWAQPEEEYKPGPVSSRQFPPVLGKEESFAAWMQTILCHLPWGQRMGPGLKLWFGLPLLTHALKIVFANYIGGKKKFGKTGVQEIPNRSTCAVKVNLNSGISSLLKFGNAIKAFY